MVTENENIKVVFSRDLKTGVHYLQAMGTESWIKKCITPYHGCELVTRDAYPCELEQYGKDWEERDLSGGSYQ